MNQPREEALEGLRAEIRHRFPIEEIIDELGSGRKPRDAVLGAAAALASEIAPTLMAAVERAATGAELGEREWGLAFYGLHILGGARDKRAFPALMGILRLPSDRLDRLLGDALTETIKRVAIGTFDGQASELYALIADQEVDEFARYEMLTVLPFLAFEGRIEIDEVKRFLIKFDDERLAPECDMAWCGWEDAIALLGFRDLVPRVEAAWQDGRTQEGFSEPKYFFEDLRRAETEWNNAERFKRLHHLGYIEDIAEELSWIATPEGRDESEGDGDASARAALDALIHEYGLSQLHTIPYTNPTRHVGRNDPCPCGSGKKAKRCCLAG